MTWFHIFAIVWTLILVVSVTYMIVGIRRATADHRLRDEATSRRREVSSRPRTFTLDDRGDPKGNP